MKVFIQSTRHERFEAIYKQRYLRVWRYFRKNRVSDAESHDLTQDTFVRFYEYMDDLRDVEKGNQLLDAIARTVLLNHVRYWNAEIRARANTVESDGIEGFDAASPHPPDPETNIDQKREVALLLENIKQLPRTQFEALMLFLQGHSYDEIAKLLRTTVNGVKARLRDARRSLRDDIPEE